VKEEENKEIIITKETTVLIPENFSAIEHDLILWDSP
jgi:hypothetical protein